MMLLMCAGLCLFLTLGFGFGVCFVALPLMMIRFPTLIMGALEFLMSLGGFYWEIIIFLIGLFMEVGGAMMHVFINALPILIHAGTELFHAVSEIVTVFRYQYIPQLLDFFENQRDIFVLFWGFVVASVYTIYNQFRTVGNGMNNYRRRAAREGAIFWNGAGDGDHNDDNNNDDGDDSEDDVINDRNEDEYNAQYGARNRHGEHRNRRNNQPDGHAVTRNNQRRRQVDGRNTQRNGQDNGLFEEEKCVVCFERDRNAAVFPCGHTQTCLVCTRNVMTLNQRCPICQNKIREFRQVFL